MQGKEEVAKVRREDRDKKGRGNLAPPSFLKVGRYASRSRLV